MLIAWAMLRQPGVLLRDERSAGVDAGFEDTIYRFFAAFKSSAERLSCSSLMTSLWSIATRNACCISIGASFAKGHCSKS